MSPRMIGRSLSCVATAMLASGVACPSSCDWKFQPVAGRTFTDAGTASCH